MSDEVWLLLIGAGIGLVASIIGAFVQHFLSLRAEKKKREWDRQERDALNELHRIEQESRKMMRVSTPSERSTGVTGWSA